jgi:hypothetical protein
LDFDFLEGALNAVPADTVKEALYINAAKKLVFPVIVEGADVCAL